MNPKLSDIAVDVIRENEVKIDDLSDQFEVGERGLEYLKNEISKLNLKAAKWKVPGIELKVISERKVNDTSDNLWGGQEVTGIKKYYTVKIEGDAPQVEGFQFIGKIEHTPTGENILNISPNSKIKNLPEVYRTIKGECDVCKSNRERFNTFILQLEKDSEKFPDKKEGDLIQVGSACLKRFLPGISVSSLMNYAKIIEAIRSLKASDSENEPESENDRSMPDIYKNHIPSKTFMKYVVLSYLANGKFVAKKNANYEIGEYPTSEEALNLMFNNKNKDELPIMKKIKANSTLLNHANDLCEKVIDWMEKTNFSELGSGQPDFMNYYNNVNVLSKSPTIRAKNAGYFASILALYLRHHKDLNKKQSDGEKIYVGKIGDKITFHGKLIKLKSFNSQWGISILHVFEDLDGNKVNWFTSTDSGMIEGETYPITATVKSHQVDKYSQLPTTTVKNAKINKM